MSEKVYSEIGIILVLSLELKFPEILKLLTFNFLQNKFQEYGVEKKWKEIQMFIF